jgi:UDP-N-acetylmuramyl pentapeptide synthase
MKLRLIADALAANLVATTAAVALDANLPVYHAISGISGEIKSVGSDTLNNEMALWAKGFVDVAFRSVATEHLAREVYLKIKESLLNTAPDTKPALSDS